MADHITGHEVAAEPEDERRARLLWEAARIEEARASIREVGTVPYEEVEAWIASWDTPGELPRPRPRK
jgi:predicted transcriptional regulator